MKKASILSKVLLVSLIVVFVAPSVTFAQTINYQPRTQAEMIAYLYGRIAQLMEIKAMLERGGTQSYYQSGVTSGFGSVAVNTHSAQTVTVDSAILRGEIVLYGDATARAWFEYGQDEDFLDQRTSQSSIRNAYDRALRLQVNRLEDDTRYYFRVVAQTTDGAVIYGPIYGFRTDEKD